MMGLADAYSTVGQFDTRLTPEEEARFLRWRASLPRPLQSTDDYDLRGAWKADASAASNGHLPDTWKKPNHPTFSTESIYAKIVPGAGEWSQGPNGQWAFKAGPANFKARTPRDLSQYFAANEPASPLVLPYTRTVPVRLPK